MEAKRTKRTPKPCVQCSETFSTYQDLISHMVEIHGAVFEFKCTQCSFTANLPKVLAAHRKKVHLPQSENVENEAPVAAPPNIKTETVSET